MINKISISGGHVEKDINFHLTQFRDYFLPTYYHFNTVNMKEVNVNLNTQELMTYPPFLMQIAKYWIVDTFF